MHHSDLKVSFSSKREYLTKESYGVSFEDMVFWHVSKNLIKNHSDEDMESEVKFYSYSKGKPLELRIKTNGLTLDVNLPDTLVRQIVENYFNEFVFKHPQTLTSLNPSYFTVDATFCPESSDSGAMGIEETLTEEEVLA